MNNNKKINHLKVLVLFGLLFIFSINFVNASISGTVFEIRETPDEDIKIPFKNATIRFYTIDEEVYETLTNNTGEFYLDTEEIFLKDKYADFYFDYLEILDSEEVITKTIINNNFTSNPDVGMIINLNQREPSIKRDSLSEIQSMAESYTVGVDYPNSLIYIPPTYSKPPVLLVHGWSNVADSDVSNWGSLKSELDKNYDVFRLQYWPAKLDNRKNAGVVSSAISTTLGFYPSSNKLNVISHSMGGLAVRGYIQDMGISSSGYSRYYQNNMDKYVIIASPMYGSYFANIIDNIAEINIRNDHPMCQEFIDGKDVVAYFDGDPLYGHTEATLNMEMGSDFTWELNNKEINHNVNYLTISGRHTAVGTVINNDKEYCLGNTLETNDGVVSLINSNLAQENVPLVVLDAFHSGSFLDLLDGINKDATAGLLVNLFFKNELDYDSAMSLLDVSKRETYYDPQTDPFYKMPEELKTQGSVIIQFNASEINVVDVDLKEYDGIKTYQLENNTNTKKKFGRWFYVDIDEIPGSKIDFITMMPTGSYNVVLNNNLDYEVADIITIKPGEVTMQEIDLDRDDDGFDYEMVGGTDCNDLNENINPLEEEICNNINDDCDENTLDGFDELWLNQVTSCGIGECSDVGQYLCTEGIKNDTCMPKDPTPEVCTDGKDNDCDGLTDLEDSDDCFIPEITIVSPLDSYWYSDNSISLDLTTDTEANCTYYVGSCFQNSDSSAGCGGSGAQAMNVTGGTSHSQLIIGFQVDSIINETYESWNEIYFNCTNDQGLSKIDSIKVYTDITEPIIHNQSPTNNDIVPLGMTNFSIRYTEENLERTSLNLYIIDNKPEVELFVMSHCPYGAQAEKGIIPVFELLGDKINSEIKFVYYAMHPSQGEVEEQLNQYCIQKEQNDKYLDYLKCFLEAGDSEGCLESIGINVSKLEKCAEITDEKFDITKNLEDQSSWLSGRFPMFNINKELNEVFGVQGSPTLVINGEIVSSGRDSASYLETICSVFDEAPEECQEILSSEAPSPGFGYEYDDVVSSSSEIIPVPSNTSSGGSSGGGSVNIRTLRYSYSKSSCPSGADQECFFEINLSDYVNKKIKYWFSLEDIADTVTYGDISNLEVLSGPVTLNLTKHIENETIQLKDNGDIVIEFNATNDSTNLTNLEVVRQSNEDEYAYLLIFGLDLTSQNKTKTVYLDRIMNGTGICIKDEEFLNISEISSGCSGVDEYWLACPGINGDYNCSLVEDNTRYRISGLKHSGIKEQETYCGDGIPNGDESCSSCPVDVGICPPVDEKINSGGGGGGNPAPKENVSIINQTNITLNTTGESGLPSNGMEIESDKDAPQEDDMGLIGITGAVVGGVLARSKAIISTFFIILIVGFLGVLFFKRKLKKKISNEDYLPSEKVEPYWRGKMKELTDNKN